ncbi:hypothetical protein WOLCODRAFT_164718 [Wolfiporia cocos MD-104 SS10]|uniref:Uncharacterized protein n=1 Tax=Wolfiporia cocos (strain MD-104) TaxID=742152 RepID=A0A2H3JPH3_WOLCO|nr:hypothetical protein WOLCODRAFT_164718 [Wolfiporia cocos MD-104 SS10]
MGGVGRGRGTGALTRGFTSARAASPARTWFARVRRTKQATSQELVTGHGELRPTVPLPSLISPSVHGLGTVYHAPHYARYRIAPSSTTDYSTYTLGAVARGGAPLTQTTRPHAQKPVGVAVMITRGASALRGPRPAWWNTAERSRAVAVVATSGHHTRPTPVSHASHRHTAPYFPTFPVRAHRCATLTVPPDDPNSLRDSARPCSAKGTRFYSQPGSRAAAVTVPIGDAVTRASQLQNQ